MNSSLVYIAQESPHICVLTLNRPSKRNALNIELMEAFVAALEKAMQNPLQRVIIIRGEGPVFCAGLDLEEAQDLAKVEVSAKLLAKLLILLYQCPLATIAVVHGAALAGGAGLMCACDFAVAAADAIFGFPETRRGLVAALIMSFLCHQLRQRDLKELLLSGALIDAKKAKDIGLINEITSTKEELFPSAIKFAEDVIQGAPKATAQTKSLLHEMTAPNFLHDLELAMKVHEQVRHSDEVREGISAFLERREPNWTHTHETFEH